MVMGKYEDVVNFLVNHEALMYYIHLLIHFVCESRTPYIIIQLKMSFFKQNLSISYS